MAEDAQQKHKNFRRSLRAVFAADFTGFSGEMSADETSAISVLNEIRAIVKQQLQAHDGWLFGTPGNGVFALFESAVNAVRCALETQHQFASRADAEDPCLRIGIHLGDVLFDGDLPYGEALTIAALLEDLADPGGILVSGAVMDAVSSRISATFEERGVPRLKNIARQIVTFAVTPPPERATADETRVGTSVLDRTTQFDLDTLRRVRDEQFAEQRKDRAAGNSNGAIILDKRPTSQSQGLNGNIMPAFRKASPSAEDAAAGQIQPSGAAAKTRISPADPSPPEKIDRPVGREPLERRPGQTPKASERAATASEAEPKTNSSPQAAGYRPSEECVEALIAALAVHLGPFAKVLVNRLLKNASSTEQLVSLLEEKIQGAEERFLFRIRALHICTTFADRQTDES